MLDPAVLSEAVSCYLIWLKPLKVQCVGLSGFAFCNQINLEILLLPSRSPTSVVEVWQTPKKKCKTPSRCLFVSSKLLKKTWRTVLKRPCSLCRQKRLILRSHYECCIQFLTIDPPTSYTLDV